MGKNVLVSGGLGHLGSRLIRDLARNHDVDRVRIIDNISNQRFPSLFHLPEVVEYEFVEGDVTRADDLRPAMKGIDVVYHLAAITDAPATFKMEKLTRTVNELGTRRVVREAVRAGVQRLVYPSTTSVYGPTSGVARENCSDSDYKPASPYAKYKLAGESEVIKGCGSGLDATVMRFGTIYGPSIGMRFHTAVNKFVLQACMGQPLTVWRGAYDQKRPYLNIDDAMRAFIFMMKPRRGTGEIYNVVTENATVRQVVEAIKDYIPTVKVIFTESPLLNQLSYYTDDSKIRSLGFKPKGSLKQGIGKTISMLHGLLSRK